MPHFNYRIYVINVLALGAFELKQKTKAPAYCKNIYLSKDSAWNQTNSHK